MNRHHRRLPVALSLVAAWFVTAVQAGEVSVEARDGGYCVSTPNYALTVAKNGGASSLSVGGLEFFPARAGSPLGAYLYQNGLLKQAEISKTADNTLLVKYPQATLAYECAAEGMTWKVANLSDKGLELVLLFGPAVQAVMDERGGIWKPVVVQEWTTTTWFRDKAKLRIEGGTRQWGPFAGDLQVWTASVPAKETRTVRLFPGSATADEMAKVAAAKPFKLEPPPEPTGPMWDVKALSKAPAYRPAPGFKSEGLQAIFFDGLPYQGKPTRVFAWLGLPKRAAGEKVPGMVLVHGGGGTAFDTWVRLWVERGYAAIAMDTCGCVPQGKYGKWTRHEAGGPPGWGGWNQIDWPHADQWTYHAVADAVLAHSLLRSLPEVDTQRVGLTGISWGGYLTSILAGVDARFKFAVPVYGCGFTNEHGFAASVARLGPERCARWMRWWDPSSYLAGAAMPMLWVTGSNDFAYTLNALQKSYRLPTGPHTLAIRLRMPHGHGAAGEQPKEIHAFADSFCKNGPPLARIVEQGRKGGDLWLTYQSSCPIAKAELNYTCDVGRWQDRKWVAIPAQLDAEKKRVSAALPAGAKVSYFNLFDDRGCAVSSEHVVE